MNHSLVYLSVPYSGQEELSFHVSCTVASNLMLQGMCVFSPIIHSHALVCEDKTLPKNDHDFWLKQDLTILEKCDILAVVTLHGWEESRGVQEEIAFANENFIPIIYLHPTIKSVGN